MRAVLSCPAPMTYPFALRLSAKPTTKADTPERGTNVRSLDRARRCNRGLKIEVWSFQPATAKVMVFLVVNPVLYGITHVPKNKDRKGCHALFLFLTECSIERLPCVGKFL